VRYARHILTPKSLRLGHCHLLDFGSLDSLDPSFHAISRGELMLKPEQPQQKPTRSRSDSPGESRHNPPEESPKKRSLPRSKKTWAIAGMGLGGIVLGGATAALLLSGSFARLPLPGANTGTTLTNTLSGESSALALASLSPAQRSAQLETLAQGAPSVERNRARYMLAVDLIEQNQGGSALPWLEGLENDYPELAAYILTRRAQAYAATGNAEQAEETWKAVVEQYGDRPVAAEALYHLGRSNPQYQDQLLAEFPAHPRSVEVALTRLQQNPNQPNLMLLLARHGHYLTDIGSVLDRLRTDFTGQLTPADWEAIAFAYWEIQRYGSAAEAYAKAEPTALNLYRSARGAQLDERASVARTRYQALLQAFPEEEESGLALLRLAALAQTSAQAIPFLDQAIEQFPDQAAEALKAKADAFLELNSPDTALKLQQQVLSEYSNSEAAAELRWQQVEQHVRANNLQSAWEWAWQLVEENPNHENAPRAAFWVGKWAERLGNRDEAKQAFEYVLAEYPESYYAWRSATFLGWDVGNFGTVRDKLPQVAKPGVRSEALAGSETLRELHRLGQARDAWSLWQVEFTNRVEPTVSEQFTDGLMRLGVNDNLDGIFMLASLDFRDRPEERQEVEELQQKADYWQALYPFPYAEPIEQWSQQRQLNPMLVTALIRQESRFESKIRSVVGATGLMQVMPETADWVANQISLSQYNLEDPNDNINLGTWYLDYTHQEYANNSLFAVASYNAGPGSVADWMGRFDYSDPDQFIEQIPFNETKGYVKAVFENYWNYMRLYNPELSQQLASHSNRHSKLVSSRN
jgi:soluble lytic murein transglycosylase